MGICEVGCFFVTFDLIVLGLGLQVTGLICSLLIRGSWWVCLRLLLLLIYTVCFGLIDVGCILSAFGFLFDVVGLLVIAVALLCFGWGLLWI